MKPQCVNGMTTVTGLRDPALRLRILALTFLACCCSCSMILGKHILRLESATDIRAAPSDTEDIIIPELPLPAYPLLSKFRKLTHVAFYIEDGTGGSDEKLRALAAVDLPNLDDIMLLNCPLVTDNGIYALSKVPRLKHLQLEGTSISDKGCAIMASQMRLVGVNVANCTNVTKEGVAALAKSPTIAHLAFSFDSLSQHEVEELIDAFQGTWCSIVDRPGKLNEAALKAKAAQKGITVVVKPYGALQSMKMTDEEHRELLKKRGKLK